MERYKILVWILRALLSLEIVEYLEHQQEERKATDESSPFLIPTFYQISFSKFPTVIR